MKVILLMAMTLDGKIGLSADHFPDWTGSADKRLFVEISRRAGAVIMGSKTFDTIGTPLPERKNIVLTRNPERISDHKNLVFTNGAPKQILDDLADAGYSQVVLAGGALVNSLFAEEKLIDELIVTVSPLIFGVGLSLFIPEIRMEMSLIAVDRLDDDVVCLHYRILK